MTLLSYYNSTNAAPPAAATEAEKKYFKKKKKTQKCSKIIFHMIGSFKAHVRIMKLHIDLFMNSYKFIEGCSITAAILQKGFVGSG